MINPSERREDTLIFAGIALIWGVGSMVLLGPLALMIAAMTLVIAVIFGLQIVGALVITCCGAALGILLWGAEEWLFGPVNAMIEIYRNFLFDAHRFDFQELFAHFGRMFVHLQAWPYFAPLGVSAGGFYCIIWQVLTRSPLKRAALLRRKGGFGDGFMLRRARHAVNEAPAQTDAGTLLGVDRDDRKHVDLSDTDANTHTFVLGTVGSGKTVSLLNLVESAINRGMPVFYVDGKGDFDLASQVIAYARARGRPAYLFAMNGQSSIYNPLSTGGYTSKKDRIIGLREWSEDHYKEIAEGYLQLVFKVLDACEIDIDLVSLADYMNFDRLIRLIKAKADKLDQPERLLSDIEKRREVERQIESLREIVWKIAESEIGHLFDTVNGPAEMPVLELLTALEERAVVYFCLPSLEFPEQAKGIGKLVVNDLKSVGATQLRKPKRERLPFYAIFDEFSVFAGEQVLNLINMGRGAGVHAVLATQSVADIGRAVTNGPDHFIRQVFGSCNSYLVHRLNAAEDVTTIVETIGTKDHVEHTAQVDMLGSTGMGSARQTKTFQVHPDEIKQLPRGDAVFVNKNRNEIHHLLVRHSMIDRAA